MSSSAPIDFALLLELIIVVLALSLGHDELIHDLVHFVVVTLGCSLTSLSMLLYYTPDQALYNGLYLNSQLSPQMRCFDL
jgi:hypothetical protein